MILRGKNRQQCMNYIKEEGQRLGYTYTDIQCSNIHKQVKSELKKELEDGREYLVSDLASKLYYIYNKTVEKEDWKEARCCLSDIAKLIGATGNSVEIKQDSQEIKIQFA